MRRMTVLAMALGAAMVAGGTARATPFIWQNYLAQGDNQNNGAIYIEECPPGTAQNAHIFDGTCKAAPGYAGIDGEPQILQVTGTIGQGLSPDNWSAPVTLPHGYLSAAGDGSIICSGAIEQGGFIGDDASYWPAGWMPLDNHFYAKSSSADLNASFAVCAVQALAVVNGVGTNFHNVRAKPTLFMWNTDPISYSAPGSGLGPQAINLRIDFPLGPQYGNYTRRYFFYFVPTALKP